MLMAIYLHRLIDLLHLAEYAFGHAHHLFTRDSGPVTGLFLLTIGLFILSGHFIGKDSIVEILQNSGLDIVHVTENR